MLIKSCKLPRHTCEYWEQYGSLGNCLVRLIQEEQDVVSVPRVLSRYECTCNREITVDDELSEIQLAASNSSMANILYYYEQIDYPVTAGWKLDPLVQILRANEINTKLQEIRRTLQQLTPLVSATSQEKIQQIKLLLGDIAHETK